MAKKKLPEVQESGLGDITEIMHNQGPVSDYSWLAVNEQDYRDAEALPRQNLDIIPELTAALTYDEKDDILRATPLRPHTIVNTNPLEDKGPSVRPSALTAVVNKVASYVVANKPAREIQARLQAEFSPAEINAAGPQIKEVLCERGLLGNIYIDAKHFPRCAQQGPHKEFVARHASNASFILAKDACHGCVHHKCGQCAVFKKRVVASIPYNLKTFAHYAPGLVNAKRLANTEKLPKSSQEIKRALQAAFNKTPIQPRESSRSIQHHPKPVKPQLTEKDYEDYWARQAQESTAEKMPSSLYLVAAGRLMQKRINPSSIWASSDSEVRKLINEYGIIGHTYVDVDAIGGCSAALSLISSHKLSPDFALLRRAENSKAQAELAKITPVVSKRPVLSKKYFMSACERAVREGRMSADQAMAAIKNAPEHVHWAPLIAQANLYTPPAKQQTTASPAPRGTFHYGDPGRETTAPQVNPDEVFKFISHQMNLGLSGRQLQAAILSRYSPSDLQQVPEVGQRLASNEGAQGVYFIDPSIYPDHGKGCVAGSKHFRKRGAAYLLVSSECTGCIYQTAPSWCSKYCKRMIRRAAADSIKENLRQSKSQISPPEPAPIENPVEKYELASELAIDTNGSKSREIEISIPSREIDK